jgi:Mrp family chromosome partitioning ATPase/uncharacterized protein involved in exopolysaccharide biosynthesis
LRIFRKRRFTIIITFLLVTSLSIAYFSKGIAVYQASATIKIEERKTIAGLLTEEIMFNPADVMESETRLIKGYPIMKKVALKLGKIEENNSLEQINNAISALQSSVQTERIGSTNMIRITATLATAKEAMDLANTVALVYIEESLLEKAKQARHGRQFIEEQLVSLENRLREAEQALSKFGDEIKNIKLAEPIQQKLVELQFKLAELLQKYTEKHPQVIQIRDQIKNMEAQIKGFSGQEIEYARLNREVEVNKKLYAMLKEKLEEARITEAQKVSDVSIVDPAVMPSAPISGDNSLKILIAAMMGLILGVSFAFIFETLDTSIGTIEDVENVVKLPVLGVIPSFESETQQDKEFFTRIKERFFPKQKTEEEEKAVRLIAHYKPRSPITEAYRNIHTNLKLSASKKTILVTSSSPREGKSSIVCNLGVVMAQVGLKTVLVSTDLRRPVLAKTFGVKKVPGLNELMMGTASLEGVLRNITDIILGDMKFEDIRKTPGIENIWIIPSGPLPANPVELLESKGMENLIEMLKKQFDVVIFDTPPVLPVTDASILAPKMDCVVIVYEIGRTSREALLRAKVQLESMGAKISGIILNHTKAQTESISSYPYYHYRYKYYGKPETEKEDKVEKPAGEQKTS